MDRQVLNRLIDDYAIAYGCDYALWKATGIWDASGTARALAVLDDYLDTALAEPKPYYREEALQDCLNNLHLLDDDNQGIYENE